MNILIVDDEENLRNVIKEYALSEGYNVFLASNGYEAIEITDREKIDCMILDIMMPSLDGFSTLKEITGVPTIILSARISEEDKLLGFDYGIEDYMTKPFSPKELMARIKVILKRYNKDDYTFGNLSINTLGHYVCIDNIDLKLTPKEYELLLYLVKNKDKAISRDTLLDKIWGIDYFGDDRTVDTHIKKLRNSLGECRNFIVTVRNIGYKFVSI